ncbi:MAG: hypothetical protein DHS20C15_30300 [Planctomycetota bacterium]|nr:MAG: hypothetical protein DHS20C15_30300 [Planctomycetota bacterium]
MGHVPTNSAPPETAHSTAPGISRWQRRWFQLRFHVWLHLGALVALLGAYIALHVFLSPSYRCDVQPLIKSAAAEYQIRVDPSTQLFALHRDDTLITPDESVDAAGHSGLGRLPSVDGFLHDVESRVLELNDALAIFLRETSAVFVATERLRTYRAPAAAFAEQDQVGLWVEAPFHNGAPSETPLNVEGYTRLRNALSLATVVDLANRTRLCDPDTYRIEGAHLDSVGELCERELRERDVTVAERGRLVAGLESDWCCLIATLGQFLSASIADLDSGRASSEAATPTERVSNSEDCLPDCSGSMARWNTDLHTRIAELAQAELGWFWLYGSWRWVEVLLFTMFGVLVEAAVRLGLHMTGRTQNPDECWEPAETARSGLKLLYAPVISFVMVWTLLATDFLEVDIVGAGSATAVITIAFLFGLFPNLPYSLFTRLAIAIFEHTSVAASPRRAETRTKRVASVTDIEEGDPPDFRELKAKIIEHATAPLKT